VTELEIVLLLEDTVLVTKLYKLCEYMRIGNALYQGCSESNLHLFWATNAGATGNWSTSVLFLSLQCDS
jgi:hypothetical protein